MPQCKKMWSQPAEGLRRACVRDFVGLLNFGNDFALATINLAAAQINPVSFYRFMEELGAPAATAQSTSTPWREAASTIPLYIIFEVRSGKDLPGYPHRHTSCNKREDYIDHSAKWT